MRTKSICLLFLLGLSLQPAHAQGTVPNLHALRRPGLLHSAGRDPIQGGTTTIPTVLVPIALSFDAKKTAGKPFVMDAAADVSPISARQSSPSSLSRPAAPRSMPTPCCAPPSPRRRMAHAARQAGGEADKYHHSRRLRLRPHLEEERQLLRRCRHRISAEGALQTVPKQDGKLVIAVTHNTTYYAEGDATLAAPGGRTESIRPPETPSCSGRISVPRRRWSKTATCSRSPSNSRSSSTIRCTILCSTAATSRFRETPSRLAASRVALRATRAAAAAHASPPLLPSRTDQYEPQEQFSRVEGLCRSRRRSRLPSAECGAAALVHGLRRVLATRTAFRTRRRSPHPRSHARRGTVRAGAHHPNPQSRQSRQRPAQRASADRLLDRLRLLVRFRSEVSPQWDVIIVAFATPDKNAPRRDHAVPRTPAGLDREQFKADIAYLKSQGKKVMISLGGGGQHFTLADPKRVSQLRLLGDPHRQRIRLRRHRSSTSRARRWPSIPATRTSSIPPRHRS